MVSRFLKMVVLGIKQFSDPYYQGFAAQLSFYIMFSIVPVILIVSQIMTTVFQHSLESAVGWILDFTGGSFGDEISGLVLGGGSGALSIFFVIMALWASSRAQFSLMRIANFTLSGGETTGRGYFRDRIRAIGTMFITLLTVIFALVVMVYGEPILKMILSFLNLDANTARIWLYLRWPIALALYFFTIGYNYYFLPINRVRFKDLIPGTIFASIGLLLVTLFYSLYMNNLANYNILYGSLASIIALMFWFYLLSWVLALGILFNKVWADTKPGAIKEYD
ncbi:MAG: YihY/virulence factor BrkB family protein [Anaerovoracaceae bacterium]